MKSIFLHIYHCFWFEKGLTSRCKTYQQPKYEYKDFFKLSDIEDSQPSGYQVRLAFYAQGTRNAHILLSQTAKPNVLTESAYEFGANFFPYLSSLNDVSIFNNFDLF